MPLNLHENVFYNQTKSTEIDFQAKNETVLSVLDLFFYYGMKYAASLFLRQEENSTYITQNYYQFSEIPYQAFMGNRMVIEKKY